MGKNAQGVTEYALIIAVVAAVLLTMQAYFKRGVQAVAKVSMDQLGGFDSGLTPGQVQNMAIKQEIDPKYGILQSQSVKISLDQSLKVTTPKDSTERKVSIIKDEEHVEDLTPKNFWQERND